jgi:hypothetical protein
MGERIFFAGVALFIPTFIFLFIILGNGARWDQGGRACMNDGKFYAEIKYATHSERVCVKDNVITKYKDEWDNG